MARLAALTALCALLAPSCAPPCRIELQAHDRVQRTGKPHHRTAGPNHIRMVDLKCPVN